MGIISKDNRQIKLYYNSETSLGKQVRAYIEASEKKIQTIDISKTKLTGLQWLEIADMLNIHIAELINQKHPDFIQIYGDKKINLEQEDWLKLIEKHPIIISYPIIINGKEFIQIKSPSEFAKYLS